MMLLIFILSLIFILGLFAICIGILGYVENREEGELWIERFMAYFESKGKQLAERKNRRIKK